MGVSTRYLKDFVTSERDILRKITRMPNNMFRLWEENVLPEEDEQSSINNQDIEEEDEEFYEDFVIVSKIDVHKYNE